eukprot:4547241-Prymnesium_polylepis.1
MDKMLGPGLLAFRNGRLLELDTDKPFVRSLAPTDYVSVAGAVDRDLPATNELAATWANDEMYSALYAKLSKNFSDEASCKQTLERTR